MIRAEHVVWDNQLAADGHVVFRAGRWSVLMSLLPVVVGGGILLSFWRDVVSRDFQVLLMFFTAVMLFALVSGVVSGVTVLSGRADLVVTPSGVGIAARTLLWSEVAGVTFVESRTGRQLTIQPQPGGGKRTLRVRHLDTPPAELAAWLESVRSRSTQH